MSKVGVVPLFNRKLRVLCLHGRRTSGKILSMQTAAIQYHTPMQYVFVDAPYPAEGPPDPGITMFYPGHAYFEWFLRGDDDRRYIGLVESLNFLVTYLIENGPFDGILGFSQGASMVTRLAHMQQSKHASFAGRQLFQFAILIGAVPPEDIPLETPLLIPSLHILGSADPLRDYSVKAVQFYGEETRTVLEHQEGHNIPSLGTGLYPVIADWVQQQFH